MHSFLFPGWNRTHLLNKVNTEKAKLLEGFETINSWLTRTAGFDHWAAIVVEKISWSQNCELILPRLSYAQPLPLEPVRLYRLQGTNHYDLRDKARLSRYLFIRQNNGTYTTRNSAGTQNLRRITTRVKIIDALWQKPSLYHTLIFKLIGYLSVD